MRSRGTFAGRFVIPLHDPNGQLVGYAGRSLDDADPKYLFPSSEKGFRQSHLLFNLHRLIEKKRTDEPVFIVEGFFSVMKLYEAGLAAVAILGSALSQRQEDLIAAHFERVILLFDGDDAGRKATKDCLERLSKRCFVSICVLDDGGGQPDQLEVACLREITG